MHLSLPIPDGLIGRRTQPKLSKISAKAAEIIFRRAIWELEEVAFVRS